MSADDIWNDLFGGFDNLNKRMEDLFSGFEGPGMRSYGYTMYQGPDGIRHVREFGNPFGTPALADGNGPFTDVSEEDGLVRIVAEIPGVERQDIGLSCTHNVLSIRVDTPGRTYSKDLALPCDVETGSAKAEYNNGLLEVTIDKAAPAEKGVRIEIE